MPFPEKLRDELEAMAGFGLTIYPVASPAERLHVVVELDARPLKPFLEVIAKQHRPMKRPFRNTEAGSRWVDTLTALFQFALGGATEVIVHLVEKDHSAVDGCCFFVFSPRRVAARNEMRAILRTAMDAVGGHRVRANVGFDDAVYFDGAECVRVSWDSWYSVLYRPPTKNATVNAEPAVAIVEGAHGRVGFGRFPERKRGSPMVPRA